MTRLTREVRFTLPFDGQVPDLAVANSFSGNLLDLPGMYLVLQVTLHGEVDPLTHYIENIKNVDQAVREAVVPALTELVQTHRYTLARAAQRAAAILHRRWSGRFDRVRISPNPYFACEVADQEHSMVYLTQRFEFSAAHRLHNPTVDEQRNRELFGKCSNPAGHGHNYEFEVTLAGSPDPAGQLIAPDQFAQIVGRACRGAIRPQASQYADDRVCLNHPHRREHRAGDPRIARWAVPRAAAPP